MLLSPYSLEVSMSMADERFYKRKLNEMEQDIKRLQREIQKLRAMQKNSRRTPDKQLTRTLQREADLQEVFDQMQAAEFQPVQVEIIKERKCDNRCKQCQSDNVHQIQAGMRTVIVCGDCSSRYTVKTKEYEVAKLA